jgi:hypothetical protein
MRIQKSGQLNWDGFSLTQLTAFQTNLIQAYNNRLQGNGLATTATEEINLGGGLFLKAVPLEELALQLQDVANAIQKKQAGSTFTTVTRPDFLGNSQGAGWGPCRGY